MHSDRVTCSYAIPLEKGEHTSGGYMAISYNTAGVSSENVWDTGLDRVKGRYVFEARHWTSAHYASLSERVSV